MKYVILLVSVMVMTSACNSSKKAVKEGAAYLTGTRWDLLKIGDKMDNDKGAKKTLEISLPDKKGSGTVNGSTGCNSFSGGYTADAEKKTINFGTLATTKKACMDVKNENAYLANLERINSYELSGKILKLYEGGNLLLTFETN